MSFKSSAIALLHNYSESVTNYELASFHEPLKMMTDRQRILKGNLEAIDNCARDAGDLWPFHQRCTGTGPGECNFAGAGAVVDGPWLGCGSWYKVASEYFSNGCDHQLHLITQNNPYWPPRDELDHDLDYPCQPGGIFNSHKICAAPRVCMADSSCRRYFASAEPWLLTSERRLEGEAKNLNVITTNAT